MTRARNPSSYRRRKSYKEPHKTVLIVCEGRKTEPLYFNALRDTLKLANSRVIVTGDCGSAPSSVVAHAHEKRIQDAQKGTHYDEVYCVFDKDSHESYMKAIKEAKSKEIIAITSVPCFELWILMHYTYTTKPYCAGGGKSICDSLIDELKIHISDYKKGMTSWSERIRNNGDAALHNAQLLEKHTSASGADNPSTKVHHLVISLIKMKRESCQTRKESFDREAGCRTAALPKLSVCATCSLL